MKDKNIQESRSVEIKGIGVWVSVFIAITFGIFGPLGLYITNINEFWFSIGDIWWIALLGGLLLFAVCFGVNLIFKDKKREICACLIFGVSLGFYIQGNWVTTDYGILDGKNINWSAYADIAIINTMIWVICFMLPFVLRHFLPEYWKKIIKYAAIFFVLIQIITLGTLLMTTNLSQNDSDTYLTTDGQFELSKNENIVIFVLDAFDSSYLKALMEEYPELTSAFDNFTYYPDMVAGGATTKIAMPAILTGVPYTQSISYSDYINYAYTQTDLFIKLKEQNYSTGIYTIPTFVSSSQSDLVDNLTTGKTKINSYGKLAKYIYQFAAFRYMPHLLKSKFWFYSGIFDELKSGSNAKNYSYDNVTFYQNMMEDGISSDIEGNSFRLYYLLGAHPPYEMNEYAEKVSPNETSQLQQAKGSLYIIEEYMNQLKQAGIYDNTAIIIMADHGDIGHHHNPLFMIKLFGESKDFCTSYAPLSYYDLHATLLSIITGNDKDYGKTIFDFEEGDKRERYFYFNASENYLTSIVEYAINGYAGDDSSVIATGNIYTGNSDDSLIAHEYDFGTVLTFGPDGTAMSHCISGFSGIDMLNYTWTDGKTAKMRFDLSEIPNQNLITSINTMVYSSVRSQRVIVRVGEKIVHAGIYDKTSTIDFVVPKELLDGKTLILDFEFPDAVCPQEVFGAGHDSRTLAFALMNMSISEGILEDENEICSYSLGDVIEFTSEKNGTRYFKNGINKIDQNYAWSSGNKSWMIMETGEVDSNLVCFIDFASVLNGSQRLTISTRGTTLYDDIVTSDKKTISFTIPAEYIASQTISLDFEYQDAASPKNFGTGTDVRVLAVAFKSITIKRTDEYMKFKKLFFTDGKAVISFSEDGNDKLYITEGTDWYTNQKTYRWTGKYAELQTDIDSDVDLTMTVYGYVYQQSGGSIVTLNGTVVANLDAGDGFRQYEIALPSKLLKADGLQTIAFSSENAVSPFDAGTGKDKRELGIALSTITFEKVSIVGEGS